MLPALSDRADAHRPHAPLLAAGANPAEADAAQQLAAEDVRVLPEPKRHDDDVMEH
jgi:hypothetical protein